jgi:SulP family sulfate permease
LFKPALALAMLGSIESLLSAVVADGMTVDEHHDSNRELIGQGIGNILSPLFGGIAATGAIARTAVNISAGAKTRIAGVIHSVVILLLMLVFAPLAAQIPLAALSGVLVLAAIRMIERESILLTIKSSRPGLAVMGLTLAVTILVDLVAAIEVGLIAAGALFVYRMSKLGVYHDDQLDVVTQSCELTPKVDSRIVAYRIDGPLFFGVVERFINIASAHPNMKFLILRMRRVSMIDTSGIFALQTIQGNLKRKNCKLFISGLQDNVLKKLEVTGFIDEIGQENIFEWTRDAMVTAQNTLQMEEMPQENIQMGKIIHT